MSKKTPVADLFPRYRGVRWIAPQLPDAGESWLLGKQHSVAKESARHAAKAEMLGKLIDQAPWKWPKRPLFFISDPHADAEAFMASLVASGGLRKTGPGDDDFKLTRAAERSKFLLGGDCFDKGPSVLRLLRSIKAVSDRGLKLSMLAGNHDVRVLMGLRAVGASRDPRNEHFFVRMGPKAVPLLKEIHENYLRGRDGRRGVPDTRTCRKRLFPSKRWFDAFAQTARWMMPESAVDKEMKRLGVKVERFEADCAQAGLSLRMVYAAAMKSRELFVDPGGEFGWFFRHLRLAHREGAFLFVHAGVDDRVARLIVDHGVGHLNRLFRLHAWQDPFEFYYGPLANTIRTKYRDVDMPFSAHGVKLLGQAGIHAIVHGHRNLLHGQRIMLRGGMINFECDTSLDRHTRHGEGMEGYGASVTVFRPEGVVMGISNDYPKIKVFDPGRLVRGIAKKGKQR